MAVYFTGITAVANASATRNGRIEFILHGYFNITGSGYSNVATIGFQVCSEYFS
jgi:hypothetical protein